MQHILCFFTLQCLLKLTRFHSFQVELFSHADTIIVMDEGRFKYCGPFHPPTIRKLFPNASVPDVPADGAPSDVDVQAGDNMLAVGPVSGNPNAISVYGMAFGNDGGWSLPAPTTTLTKTTSHHDLQLQIAQLEVVVDSHKGPRLKAPVEVSKAPKGGYSELIARWRWYSVVPWFFFMCFAAQSARTWSDIWISQWTQNKNAWGAPFGMGPLQKWEYFGIYVAFIGMFFFLQVQFLCKEMPAALKALTMMLIALCLHILIMLFTKSLRDRFGAASGSLEWVSMPRAASMPQPSMR